MKDEIKENVKIIKDWFKQYYEKPEKVTIFMIDQDNRIKELEQINEEHRELNGNLRTANSTLCEVEDFMYNQAKDYKTRIDKAIEYIKKNKYVDDYGKWTIDDDNDYLLNILQGKSDE